jgi:hypothetical protein
LWVASLLISRVVNRETPCRGIEDRRKSGRVVVAPEGRCEKTMIHGCRHIMTYTIVRHTNDLPCSKLIALVKSESLSS